MQLQKGILFTAVCLLLAPGFVPAGRAQFLQQAKLAGNGFVPSTGATPGVAEGQSVALSSDGNTAIVGGPRDNGLIGAAWAFTRSGGIWTQQGAKLVGTGTVAGALSGQGSSVSLSADGNTAIVGGPYDNFNRGAAWIYSRSAGAWSQVGAKLVGTGSSSGGDFSDVRQGASVALSGDGNTALVGGPEDAGGVGAVWVFTNSGGVWAQQGAKLVPSDGVSFSTFGYAVALSSDGNTAIIGGRNDNSGVGAIWIFTRTSGAWAQQGSKIIGSGAVALSYFGTSVALSTDGSTVAVGGSGDSGANGALWILTRSGGTYTPVGGKLTATGETGAGELGSSVALSSNGVTAIAGAPQDNGGVGALFVFTQTAGAWSQRGNKVIPTGALGTVTGLGTATAVSSDGTTAISGGPTDGVDASPNFLAIGAAWVFTQPNGPHFGVSAPTTALVGNSISFTVTALDTNGNPTPGYSGTVHFTSTDPSATLPANTTLTNGAGTFTAILRTAGAQSISATDTVTTSLTGTSAPIAVTVGTTPVGASPNSGSGTSTIFTFQFSDPRGWQDLDVVNVLINNFLDGRNACYLAYSRTTASLFLVGDDGGTLLYLPLNGSGSVQNSQCMVNGAGSSATGPGNGNVLTLVVNLTFKSAFAGNKIIYMAARDLEGGNSGWVAEGVWNVPGSSTNPAPVSVSPASGQGLSQTFTYTFTDTKGVNDLGVLNVLINNFLDGRSACYIAYSQQLNVLYLVGDAGGGLSNGLTLGGTGSVSNSQCTINAAGSSAVVSGNTVTLTLNINFTTAFDGNRVVYMAARDTTGANNSGWQSLGTWLVK